MQWLFGSHKTTPQSQQAPAVTGIQIQTSSFGKVIPVVLGTTRIPGNLLWYDDLKAISHTTTTGGGAGGGGKGLFGGGGAAAQTQTTYTYTAAFQFALCEGPIAGVRKIWASKDVTNAPALGFDVFIGNYGQAEWSYLVSAHPDKALSYSGIAYVAAAAYDLKESPSMPNHNFEVLGLYYNELNALDAAPDNMVRGILSDPNWGLGFPASRIGDLTTYRSYCFADGLFLSAGYTDQQTAAQALQDIAQCTNSEWRWDGQTLTVIPYGDQTITANGFTYTALSAPLFDLTDDDFKDPPKLARKRPADVVNSIQLEFLDRDNDYNIDIVEYKDQALIDLYGLRSEQRTFHQICRRDIAQESVNLQGQRESIRNTYTFTVDARYGILDPMDIVSITDPILGLVRQWVRINKMTENGDQYWDIEADEVLDGTGATAQYSYSGGASRFIPNFGAAPGHVNTPVIFEPPDILTDGKLEVWAIVSGGANYGGCSIFISTDDATYRFLDTKLGKGRTGFLRSNLPAVPISETGISLDGTPATVDLSESTGILLSGTVADRDAFNTLMYVEGELFSYKDAQLVAPSTYVLSGLARDAYSTGPTDHSTGERVARIDETVIRIPYTGDRVGQALWLKFTAFNIYQTALEDLSSVPSYRYVIRGTSYFSPMPDVENLTTLFEGGLIKLSWDPVTDFRPVDYEIRKGQTWFSGQILGRTPSTVFASYGDGLYLVKAHSSPKQGFDVYSQDAAEIELVGSVLVSNVIASFDEGATGWSGFAAGSGVALGGIFQTSDSGNVLGIANWLSTGDIFSFGGGQSSAIYQIPDSHVIDVGSVVSCQVICQWDSIAQAILSLNILTINDWIGAKDILGSAATGNTDIHPEIALSQDGTTFDFWQRWVPGYYAARKFTARMVLDTLDAQTQCLLERFIFSVDVPDRDDHYHLDLPTGGLAVLFTPDGAPTPIAFNGGPNGSTVPAIQGTILAATAGDDLKVTSLTKAGCTLQVVNGGGGVARTVNIIAQGY